MSNVSESEKGMKKLQLETQMIDDRIIEAKEFLDYDNFIESNKFKSFLLKIKINEYFRGLLNT